MLTARTRGEAPVTVPGTYVDLYDATLAICVDPTIAPGVRYFLVDVNRADPGHAWVLAASGRVDSEVYTNDALTCTVSGAADTIMVMRAILPREPEAVEGEALTYTWDTSSRTVFVTGPADPAGVTLTVRF